MVRPSVKKEGYIDMNTNNETAVAEIRKQVRTILGAARHTENADARREMFLGASHLADVAAGIEGQGTVPAWLSDMISRCKTAGSMHQR